MGHLTRRGRDDVFLGRSSTVPRIKRAFSSCFTWVFLVFLAFL